MRQLLFGVLWLSTAALAADTPFEFADASEAARFRALATQLRCLVCQNQTIEDSHAPLAQDLRKEVLRLMREGRTDDDIKAYLTQRYGDFVLYQPRMKPATYLLWYGPPLLLLAGLVLAWRRWRARHMHGGAVLDAAERANAWALLDAAAGADGGEDVSRAGSGAGRHPGARTGAALARLERNVGKAART